MGASDFLRKKAEETRAKGADTTRYDEKTGVRMDNGNDSYNTVWENYKRVKASDLAPKVAGGTVNPIISFGNVRENPVLKRKTNTTKTYSQALTESRNKAKVLENGAKLPAVIPPKGDVSKLILPDNGGGGTVNPTLKRNEVRTNYDYMTDREAAVYKYYRDRGQVEKAQEYLDALEMDVNQRAAMQKREDAKKLAEESTAAALYARAVGNIGQAAGAVYAAAMEGADKPVDPYHPLMGGVNMNEGLAEGLMGDSTGAEKFAKEAGLAVFDWGTQAATLGPLTPYVMAAGAAAGNTKEALERGGTTDEAVMYGLAGGAAEAITEKLGYDRLFELGKITKNKGAVSTFLKSLLPQAASEGAEEATSEIANILADTLIMGDNSQMKQIAQTAMENGATESEAVKTALMEGIKQVGYSGAVGAASGGVIAGGIGGMSRMTGRNTLEMAGNPVETARDAMTNAGNEVTQKINAMRSQGKEEVPGGTTQGNVLPEQGNVLPEQGNVMVNRENVPEVTQQNKALRDFGEKYYYTEGQKLVNEEAERRGDTSFIPAFQTYYTAGLTGVKESDIKQTAETIVADKGLLSAAYLAGVNDRKADLEARMKGTGKMGQTAGVFLETEAVTKEQRSFAELVSRVAELEVVLVDELPQDRRGYYENNKGRVTIALNSGQFAGTLFHEATHYIREANPEGYDRLRNAVFSAAAAMKDMDLETYTKKYEKMYGEAYQEAGQEVDYDVILEEMTADAFAEIAGDEKTFKKFVKEMQNTNPSVLEKIKEFLENLLETLKGLVNDGRFSSFGGEIRKDVKATEKFATMLAEEMKKVGEMQREEKAGKGKGKDTEKKLSKKIGGVFPEINVSVEDFKQMGISEKSLNNLKVIEEKVYQYLSGKFLSEGNREKPILNLDTGMEVCVYRGGINETFRKDAYYKNLSSEWKKIKLAAMMHMDMLIKYGEIREKEAVNYHNENSTTRFAYLTAPILVGGKPYTVDIDIKRTDRGDRFHVHKIKIADSSAQAARMRPVFEVELSAEQIIAQDNREDNGKERESENRFSLKEPIEETKDLIAVHNLTGEKLRKLLDLQGIPMPSIAITKSDATAEDFGEISLVFRKDAIDPADERNKVYDADAWTPMFPTLDKEEYRKTRAFLEELVRTMQAQTKSGKNAQGFMGENTMRAAMANRFVSLGEIKEAREKLEHLPKEEFEALREEMNQRLFGVLEEIYDTGSQTGINEVYEMEDIGEQIQNMAEEVKGVPSAQQIQQNLKKAGYPISMELAEQTARVLEEIKEMPTDFFEAKPERVVEFAEVAAAVVPDELEVDLRKAVENKIPQVLEYEAGSKESRVRQLNRVEGVRFSIREEAHDALVEENEALKEANEALRRQFEITKDAVHDPVSAKKAVRKWLKSINSTYDVDIFTEKFLALADYVANAGDQVDMQMVMGALQKLAYDALSESKVLNTDLSDAYKEFKNDVRKTKIKVTDSMLEELEYYGGYIEFRKRNFGKLNLSRQSGIPADVFYQEMAEKYPGILEEGKGKTQVQILVDLANTVDSLQPVYENPYGMNLDEYAMDAAYDLVEIYLGLKMQKAIVTEDDKKRLEEKIQVEQKRVNDSRERLREEIRKKHEEILAQVEKEARETARKKRAVSYIENVLIENERLKQRANVQWDAHKRSVMKHQEYQERAIRRYDRLLEAKFQLQDRQKKQSERRKYAKYRRIVEQETNKMLKWITKPTDTYHVPEEMTKGLKELLTKIGKSDGEIMIMQNDLFQAIKDLERFRPKDGKEEADFFVEHDEQTIDSMNEFIGKYPNGFDLENLPADEMKELADILRSIHKRITNANKFISLSRQVEVREVSEKFLSESQKMKNTIQEGRTRQVLDFFNMDLVDPYSFFSGMGDSVRNTLFKATEEGFERKIRHEAEAEKFISGIVAKKEAAAWSTATPTLYKIGGRDIYMTPAEVMSLYATYRRNQGILHLLTGGFKTAFNKLKRMTKKEAETRLENFKPYQPSRKELEDIFNTLTDKQKEVVEKAQDFLSNVVGGWGNETSMEMFGYKKFNDQRYFPISSDKDYINNVFGDPNQKQKAIVNIGMTRPTNDQAKNPIVIEDFFTVFARQIDQMSSYNAFVPVISDWNKFMGYKKYSWEAGVQEVESVKKEISRTMGQGAISYIRKFLEDIQSVNTGEKAPITKTLVSNMKRASVGANLRVAIQQPVSIVRAADMISPKYLMMAFAKGKNDFEKIYEYAPIAQWKEWGHYDMNIARGLEERIRGQSILGKLSDYSMAMASWGDKFTWGRIWKAAEMETRDKYPELKGERFDKKVGERFSEIINRTQVVDSMLHRSQIMREKTIYKQMTTSFMGEPIKTYNMMRSHIVELMKDNTKENRNKVVRSFVTLTFNAVAVAAAAAVVDALRDDDDDETWAEKWLEAFRGDYEKAESGGEKVMAFLSSNVGQNTNPFTYIPYLKDVFSLLQGFTVQRTDVGWVSDIIKSGNLLMQYIKGESTYTFAAVLANTAASLSKATGLPIASAKRDIEAIKNTVINQAMGLETQYGNKKLTYALGSEKNVSMYVKMMIDAKLSGNDKLATRIYNEMVNAGISNEKMESQLGSKEKEKIKKDSVAMEAVEAYAKKDYDTYTQKLDELRKKYSQKNIESTIRSMYEDKYGEEDIETFDKITQDFWEKEEEVESSQFKTVIDAMMEAKLSGKIGEATKLYNYMVNNGLPNDKLDSAIDSREKELLKNDPLIKEGAEAFHEGDADRYVDIVEQLKNKNYYARNVTSAIESMHDKLYGEDDEDTFETITQDFWEEDEADEMVSYELLFNAFWNGSRGTYNEVWGLLNAAGKEDKDIRASMRNRCYDAYWKAEGEGNTEEMNKAAAEYQRNGGKLETLLKPPKE